MTRLDWEKLTRSAMHPLAVSMLETMVDCEEPLSPSGLAIGLEQPLGNVSYHMRRLERLGLVRLVAVEHYYEALA